MIKIKNSSHIIKLVIMMVMMTILLMLMATPQIITGVEEWLLCVAYAEVSILGDNVLPIDGRRRCYSTVPQAQFTRESN